MNESQYQRWPCTHRITEETGVCFTRHSQLNIVYFEKEITAITWLCPWWGNSIYWRAAYQPSFPNNRRGICQTTSQTTLRPPPRHDQVAVIRNTHSQDIVPDWWTYGLCTLISSSTCLCTCVKESEEPGRCLQPYIKQGVNSRYKDDAAWSTKRCIAYSTTQSTYPLSIHVSCF